MLHGLVKGNINIVILSINGNYKLFALELLKLFFVVTVYYRLIEIKYHITGTSCLGKCTSTAKLVWKYEDITQYKFITSWTSLFNEAP